MSATRSRLSREKDVDMSSIAVKDRLQRVHRAHVLTLSTGDDMSRAIVTHAIDERSRIEGWIVRLREAIGELETVRDDNGH